MSEHTWVAVTELPVDDETAALVDRDGFWIAPATDNRDGQTRVQAKVVCSVCRCLYRNRDVVYHAFITPLPPPPIPWNTPEPWGWP